MSHLFKKVMDKPTHGAAPPAPDGQPAHDSDQQVADLDAEEVEELPQPKAGSAPKKVVRPTPQKASAPGADTNGFKTEDGKVVKVIDLSKFEEQVRAVLAAHPKDAMFKAVLAANSTMDPWGTILEMIKKPTTLELIGLCSMRLLVAKDVRGAVDASLVGIEALRNRQGKLSKSLVTLAGQIGLASVKALPQAAPFLRRVSNPLVGDDLPPFRALLNGDEATKKKAQQAHEDYATLYQENKREFGPKWKALPDDTKDQIAVSVTKWLQ